MSAEPYPHVPGHRGIDTSREAADDLVGYVSRLQSMAFDAIRLAGAAGLTTNELAERLGIERGTIQPRTSELRQRRLIRDSGVRRRNANGKRAIVWVTRGEF